MRRRLTQRDLAAWISGRWGPRRVRVDEAALIRGGRAPGWKTRAAPTQRRSWWVLPDLGTRLRRWQAPWTTLRQS